MHPHLTQAKHEAGSLPFTSVKAYTTAWLTEVQAGLHWSSAAWARFYWALENTKFVITAATEDGMHSKVVVFASLY